jgi:glycosyltransferase involved in cell wall biosynthesis
MKCLHICNDFSLTKVHSKLYNELDKLNIVQTIYNPVRGNTPIGANSIDFKTRDSKIIYSKKLSKKHKILFRRKNKFLVDDIEEKINFKTIDIIHATTFFSDGYLAYKLSKKHNIPYIVTVRGTDVSLFLKIRPDLFFILKNILSNASKIIFISNALKRNFIENYLVKLTQINIDKKSKILENGIDDFWLENLDNISDKTLNNNLLYVGRFDQNKNVINIIEAVILLKKKGFNFRLNLVGEGGKEEELIKSKSKNNPNIKFHGPIFDKKKLKKIFNNNEIFVMPSYSETFGLVYIEALSQGLPIICSINQGVHGTFSEKIGEFVIPSSPESIANGILEIHENYTEYNLNEIDFNNHNWKIISRKYSAIYNKIIK